MQRCSVPARRATHRFASLRQAPWRLGSAARQCVAGRLRHIPVASSEVTTPIRFALRSCMIGPKCEHATARVITTDASCPPLSVDGASEAMTVRAVPETISQRPTISAAATSKASAFPVLTCDGVIPSGACARERQAVAHRCRCHAARRAASSSSAIRVAGLTLADRCGTLQACNDMAQWPFAQVATAAAATRPDLVIHVGDSRSRSRKRMSCWATPGCAGSPWGYGWDAWNADFFSPWREPLLPKRAMDFRARRSRVVQPRGTRLVALFSIARGRAQPGADCNEASRRCRWRLQRSCTWCRSRPQHADTQGVRSAVERCRSMR